MSKRVVETVDVSSLWVAERLSALMVANGVPPRQQVGLLCDVCALSLSQARRKLNGAAWSFAEVFAVARHFAASLDELFSASLPPAAALEVLALDSPRPAEQDARFLMGSAVFCCRVQLGARVVGPVGESDLLTAVGKDGWLVGTRDQLDRQQVAAPFFRVRQLLVMPDDADAALRIAILDDDPATAESLADWFNASGYAACAFTDADELLASPLDGYSAFIVDFLLAGGASSQATIHRLRAVRPQAPIILLSGKLRSGEASETELVALLRALNITFFEKPVRPSVLAASIENEIDRLSARVDR